MKTLLLFFSLLCLNVTSYAQQLEVQVPAGQTLELDYPALAFYEANIKNKTAQRIDVSVRSKSTNEQVRGFGVNNNGKATVQVEQSNQLVFSNKGAKDVELRIKIVEKNVKPVQRQNTTISFTLRNNSAKAIPLIIPTVMNPNLSPFSNSGVNLKIGQEILFRAKGKKYLLLKVDDSIQNGDVVDVSALLKERKKALGLTK
jgi:hypothetical protein